MTDERDDGAAEPDDVFDRDASLREREVEAMLALTSRPPASLDARVLARRAAGERVILPVPGAVASDAAPSSATQRSRAPRARFVIPFGLAAAAAVAGVIATRAYTAARARSAATAPQVVRTDSMRSAPGVVVVAAPPPPPLAADSVLRRDADITSGATGSTPRRDDIGMGFNAPRAARPLFSARLVSYDEATVDSAAAAAMRVPATRVGIVHAAGNLQLTALARRIEQRLIAQGVAASRITVQAGAGTSGEPVPVTVTVRAPLVAR